MIPVDFLWSAASIAVFLTVTTGDVVYNNERTQEKYDYIIVGAGSAGSVIASRLSENPQVSVLLLEAGGVPSAFTEVPYFTPEIQELENGTDWNYHTETQKYACFGRKEKNLFWPRYKGLGGCSSHNYMVYTRGNHKDFDDWASAGANGWSWQDVMPFFKKSENFTISQYSNNGYHGTGGYLTVSAPRHEWKPRESFLEAGRSLGYDTIDYNGPSQTGFSVMQFTQRDGRRCSTEKAFLQPAANRPNLDILLNARVVKIEFDENKRASQVIYHYNGAEQRVSAKKEIVLSAGAIGSPHLLLLSGVGPKSQLNKMNIPVVEDLPVGENLQDHYIVGGFVWKLNQSVGLTREKALSPKSYAEFLKGRGYLTSAAGMEIMVFASTKYETSENFPDMQIQIGSNVLLADLPQYDNKDVTTCLPILARPKIRGVLELRSKNPYENPILDYQYFSDDDDLLRMIEGIRLCRSIMKTPALQQFNPQPILEGVIGCDGKDLESDDYLKCAARSMTFTDYHYSGTAKMGPQSDNTTVVTPDLKVKGVSGLRVADASIMPVIVSGNTNAASIMIGEKMAHTLKEEAKL